MKTIWKWILFGFAVFLLTFCISLPLLGGFSGLPLRSIYSFSRMPGGMMSEGIGGIGGIGVISWIGALSRLAIPLLVIGGAAALVYYLAKRPAAASPSVPTTPCASCGKPLDPGWMACPYCGKKPKKVKK